MKFEPVRVDSLRFGENGLIPVVVQEAETGDVLMVAYANRQAVERTLAEGYAHFFSRSRRKLWKKGETSGNVQKVIEVLVDCDEDALLYRVEPAGPACHTGRRTCFFRQLEDAPSKVPGRREEEDLGQAASPVSTELLEELFEVIESRKRELPEGSYVAKLIGGKWDAVLRKIGEEATEVMLAAVEPGQPALVAEVADLWFHSLVVLARYDRTLHELLEELKERRR